MWNAISWLVLGRSMGLLLMVGVFATCAALAHREWLTTKDAITRGLRDVAGASSMYAISSMLLNGFMYEFEIWRASPAVFLGFILFADTVLLLLATSYITLAIKFNQDRGR